MDSLISAAARALAAGDALAALQRVALREDPPALALRGIAMAQLGEHERARALLRRAARGFGAHEPVARARCKVAEAEVALALRDVPAANVSWTETAMLQHRHADVGVAVSIPGGLITPIVRRAEEKTLSAISNEMKDLGARARNRKLKPEEYQGGTTAVSNLGMFGIKDFSAVINPPHATILAVGAGEERAVVKKGQIVAATIMSVTLSTDHRAVDGALGAELLQAFKRHIENPLGMLV